MRRQTGERKKKKEDNEDKEEEMEKIGVKDCSVKTRIKANEPNLMLCPNGNGLKTGQNNWKSKRKRKAEKSLRIFASR